MAAHGGGHPPFAQQAASNKVRHCWATQSMAHHPWVAEAMAKHPETWITGAREGTPPSCLAISHPWMTDSMASDIAAEKKREEAAAQEVVHSPKR